jgi:hypothetical protein
VWSESGLLLYREFGLSARTPLIEIEKQSGSGQNFTPTNGEIGALEKTLISIF